MSRHFLQLDISEKRPLNPTHEVEVKPETSYSSYFSSSVLLSIDNKTLMP